MFNNPLCLVHCMAKKCEPPRRNRSYSHIGRRAYDHTGRRTYESMGRRTKSNIGRRPYDNIGRRNYNTRQLIFSVPSRTMHQQTASGSECMHATRAYDRAFNDQRDCRRPGIFHSTGLLLSGVTIANAIKKYHRSSIEGLMLCRHILEN